MLTTTLIIPACWTRGNLNPVIEYRGIDSIIVNGIHLFDSSEIIIPLKISQDKENNSLETGIYIPPGRMKGPWFGLKFKEKTNGYDLSVRVYPKDTANRCSGIAEYHFASGAESFRIQIMSDVNWYLYRESVDVDELDFVYGRSYPAVPCSAFVQNDEPLIKDTPFCFKDVDFDGVKELCFACPGFNRHYFVIFKIVDGKPYLLQCSPYNDIVYSDFPENLKAETIFDYVHRTIDVEEQFGLSAFWSDIYGLDDTTGDSFVRMRHISGTHTNYTYYGKDTQMYKDGIQSGEEICYDLLEKDCSLTSKYSVAEDNSIHLDSVVFSSADKSKVLFAGGKDALP